MTNEEILANAPEGATHHDAMATLKYKNLNRGTFFVDSTGTEFKLCGPYPNETIRSLSDIRRIVELENRLAEVEQWVAAIADDHEQIPDWIQQSARSLLASGAGMSNECLKMSNALKIANKRIDELEKYNLDLANESHNKTMAIERLENRLAEVEQQLSDANANLVEWNGLALESIGVCGFHLNGAIALWDEFEFITDHPVIAAESYFRKRDIEQQIKALEHEASLWPDDLTECSHVKSSILGSAEKLRQQLNGGE